MSYIVIDLPAATPTARTLRKQKESTGKLKLPERVNVHGIIFPKGTPVPYTFTLNAAYIVFTPGIVARLTF
jgi:hypothetical protein